VQIDQKTLDTFLSTKHLFSQDKSVFAQEKHLMLLGAYGSGKTRSSVERGVWLSLGSPNNEGLLGRAHATELETTTQAQFFEYINPNLIDTFNKKLNKVTTRPLWNGAKPSTIWFRHIIEPNPTRDHLSGLNLGWFGIDQAEDVAYSHWNKLHGRLRRKHVKRHYGFGSANPKGHNWIYKMFMLPARLKNRVERHTVPGITRDAIVELYRASPDHLLVKSETEENIHNPPDYIGNLRRNNPPEWVARFVDGSTDEWSGRIYKEFSARSIHVIDPFDVPKHWPCIVAMDAGGDAPWAILVLRQDPHSGDVFLTNEFYEAGTLLAVIANWIKNSDYSGIPHWQDAEFVCDPENKQVILEFQSVHDIHVMAAMKGPKLPGIYRVSGYLHRQKGRVRTIPNQTPKHPGMEQRGDIVVTDAPYLWFFNRCPNAIREHEEWCWDYDVRTHESKEVPVDKEDHACLIIGTMISTVEGCKPVEQIEIGDLVRTPLGPRKVTHTIMRQARVFYYTLSDGREIGATADHPVFTANGYVPFGDLADCAIGSYSWLWSSLWKCHRKRESKFQISEIVIGRVTVFVMNVVALRDRSPKRRFAVTIARWLIVASEALTMLRRTALSAVAFSLRIALSLQKPVRVVAVKDGPSKTVYNLTVEDAHCYYANGVLVSNCDALIYGLRQLPPLEEVMVKDPKMEALKHTDFFAYQEALRCARMMSEAGEGVQGMRGEGEAFMGESMIRDSYLYEKEPERERIEW